MTKIRDLRVLVPHEIWFYDELLLWLFMLLYYLVSLLIFCFYCSSGRFAIILVYWTTTFYNSEILFSLILIYTVKSQFYFFSLSISNFMFSYYNFNCFICSWSFKVVSLLCIINSICFSWFVIINIFKSSIDLLVFFSL